MPGQHEKFIHLRERMLTNAEREGDTAFAQALAHCMLNSSGGGGEADCPLGQLFIDDYVQSGILPDGYTVSKTKISRSAPSSQPPPTKEERQRLLTALHKHLEKEAAWRKDDRYLAALHQCNFFMDTHPECPLHRFLHSD